MRQVGVGATIEEIALQEDDYGALLKPHDFDHKSEENLDDRAYNKTENFPEEFKNDGSERSKYCDGDRGRR